MPKTVQKYQMNVQFGVTETGKDLKMGDIITLTANFNGREWASSMIMAENNQFSRAQFIKLIQDLADAMILHGEGNVC